MTMKRNLTLFFMSMLCGIGMQTATAQVQPFIPEAVKEFPTVRDVAISPNGEEVIFTAQSYMGNLSFLVGIKKGKEGWSTPEIVAFSGQHKDLEPAFSPDGLRLYFVSNRPNTFSADKPYNMDIWYVERTNLKAKWGVPVNMEGPINTVGNEFYPSIAANGNFYFTRDGRGTKGKDDIFVSYYKQGKYKDPESLSEAINTEGYEFNAYVAPDESFLIFSAYNRKDGFGSGDLYISYRKDNAWTPAKNMGESVNSNKMDYCPYVDDKKMMYFTSKRNAIPTTLDGMQPKEALLELMQQYENGLSRLYKVDLKKLVEGK